jgi:hypothetical protein
MEQMLAGLSARRYTLGLEPVGEQVSEQAASVGKSAVSCRFVAATQTALAELMSADLSGLDLVAFMVDGVHFGEHVCVVALGITIDGTKVPLAIEEGSTENATLVTSLIVGLRERGLDVTRPILAVLDGAKALRRAVTDVFDHPVIARCQLHRDRKESTWWCRRVFMCLDRGEDRCGGGEVGAGGGGCESVLGQDRADFADDVADGASADLEQFGEGVLGAQLALVEHGRQDAFIVGDLLGEHASAGSGQAFPAASSMPVALGARILDVPDLFGHRGELGAGHAGQRGVGEQVGHAGTQGLAVAA